MQKEENIFDYSAEKNNLLIKERQISFEQIIAAIEDDCILAIVEHPNKKKYAHQKMYVVHVADYVYLVPFVEQETGTKFLKTIIPSRKVMKRKKPLHLDEEEKDYLSSFEKGEWETVKNFEQDLLAAKQTAVNTLKKNARINIRISEGDLARIKQKAAFEGIPYQTLIASILHKYAAGH